MTVLEVLALCKEKGDSAGEQYYKEVREKLTNVSADRLCDICKKFFKYTNAPEWVKSKFVDYKGYSYNIDDGLFKKLDISTYFENPSDSYKHYHIKCELDYAGLFIWGGEHNRTMSVVLKVDDIEDILKEL